jgi:hypothetical protein
VSSWALHGLEQRLARLGKSTPASADGRQWETADGRPVSHGPSMMPQLLGWLPLPALASTVQGGVLPWSSVQRWVPHDSFTLSLMRYTLFFRLPIRKGGSLSQAAWAADQNLRGRAKIASSAAGAKQLPAHKPNPSFTSLIASSSSSSSPSSSSSTLLSFNEYPREADGS